MLVPLLTQLRAMQGQSHSISMESFYEYCGITRQGYFQAYGRQLKEATMMAQIRELVRTYRLQKDRRAGSRSLYYNLQVRSRFGLGITKFEQLLSQYGMSLLPQRVRVVTTRSSKQSWNYEDLTKGLVISCINELVVGDLTYIYQGKMLYYLFCLTDVYSGRLVGHHLSRRMRAREAKAAFDQWVTLRGDPSLSGCIHHTDGGSQYFSDLYLSAMQVAKLRISVANTCLDNAFAEQRNGLVKHHLLPTIEASGEQQLRKAVGRAITFYNTERKQKNLGWMSPVAFEQHWTNHSAPMRMRIYDRQEGLLTQRLC